MLIINNINQLVTYITQQVKFKVQNMEVNYNKIYNQQFKNKKQINPQAYIRLLIERQQRMKIKRALPSISLYSPIKNDHPQAQYHSHEKQINIRPVTYQEPPNLRFNMYNQSPSAFNALNSNRLSVGSPIIGQSVSYVPVRPLTVNPNRIDFNPHRQSTSHSRSLSRRRNLIFSNSPKKQQSSHKINLTSEEPHFNNYNRRRQSYNMDQIISNDYKDFSPLNGPQITKNLNKNTDRGDQGLSISGRSPSRSPGRKYKRIRIFSNQNSHQFKNKYTDRYRNTLEAEDKRINMNKNRDVYLNNMNSFKNQIIDNNTGNSKSREKNKLITFQNTESNRGLQKGLNIKPKKDIIPVTVNVSNLGINLAQKLLTLQQTIKNINNKLSILNQQKIKDELLKQKKNQKQKQLQRQKQQLKELLEVLRKQRELQYRLHHQRERSKIMDAEIQIDLNYERKKNKRYNSYMSQNQILQLQIQQTRRCERIARQNEQLYNKLNNNSSYKHSRSKQRNRSRKNSEGFLQDQYSEQKKGRFNANLKQRLYDFANQKKSEAKIVGFEDFPISNSKNNSDRKNNKQNEEQFAQYNIGKEKMISSPFQVEQNRKYSNINQITRYVADASLRNRYMSQN